MVNGRWSTVAGAAVGVMMVALSCRFEEDLVQPSQTAVQSEQAESGTSGKTSMGTDPAGTEKPMARSPGTGAKTVGITSPPLQHDPWETLEMTRTTLELTVPGQESIAIVDVLVPQGWVARDGLPGRVFVPLGTEGPSLPVSYGVSVVCGGECGSGVRPALNSLLRGRLEQLKKAPWSPAEIGGEGSHSHATVRVVEEDWALNGGGMWVARVEPSDDSPPQADGYHRLVCVSHREGDSAGVQVLIRAPLNLPPTAYQRLLMGCRSARTVAMGGQR
jgi:hypothetical protein